MAKTQPDALLGRINDEIRENTSMTTISDLSEELQQDIGDTIDLSIIGRGDLREIHRFLLQFMLPEYKENFQWPE